LPNGFDLIRFEWFDVVLSGLHRSDGATLVRDRKRFTATMVGHQVPKHVGRELGHRVKPGVLDDLLKLLVERPRNLECHLPGSAFSIGHAQPAIPEIAMIAIGTMKRAAVKPASDMRFLIIRRWKRQIPVRTCG
jgi:hypothetical protein